MKLSLVLFESSKDYVIRKWVITDNYISVYVSRFDWVCVLDIDFLTF